ncbi:hypothetical protein ACFV8Z_24810 [Streptomyces sp. NPDC059837]|uniref:hypothetical protein n=1 Tax=Streptomyces sp. NPDC059837 TaxID=3346968 RepID=UPI003651030D
MADERCGVGAKSLGKCRVEFDVGPSGDQGVGRGECELVPLVRSEGVSGGALDELVNARGLVGVVRGVVDQGELVQDSQRAGGLLGRDQGGLPLTGSAVSRQVSTCRFARQDGLRDAVWVEHRGELEHRPGQARGLKLVGTFDGQRPGGRHGDGLVVGQRAGLGQQPGQLLDPVGQPSAVVGAGDGGVDEVGGGLGEGEGKVSQVGGQGVDLAEGLVAAVGGEHGGEIGGGLRGLEHAHVDEASPLSGQGGFAAAGSDQGAAVLAGRPQVGRVGEVVQDHQPPAWLLTALGFQPGQEGLCGLLRVTGARRQHLDAGLRVPVHDRLAAAGADPHQHVHSAALPGGAGVVGGQLGLARAAGPGQHLAEDRSAPGVDRCA